MDIINLAEIVSTVIYTGVGLGLMIISWVIIEWITPFSIRKEIEEDQNLAIAILMAAAFIALAIIIGSVILSG
ncbi:MAG: DUF350 domain-containing protein [Pseudoprimorskyibacter sp.]|jgi:putative membrane protein|nr:DUF350 domain-containing protein [Pseudoprimorskyibacter sp.]